ncbi:MAG: hypothetical protein HYT93_04480 [Parcubacteria group bacterium]|nr:hypothetical protein [Parcubacteria group bacterium]
MVYLLPSLGSVLIGIIPLLLRKRFGSSVVLGAAAVFVTWWIAYGKMFSTVWPLFGYFGFMAILWLVASSALDTVLTQNDSRNEGDSRSVRLLNWVIAALLLIVWFGTHVAGWSAFWASTYASFIHPEERVWTQDIQPKDPRHMRMVSTTNALAQAKRQVGQLGAIGSQFELAAEYATLQLIGGELMYIVPLDYAGFRPWLNTVGVPGYIKVYAEDPRKDPELISFTDGKKMRFSPGAWFGSNLKRHLQGNGFLNVGLTSFNFEIDEKGQPWWIATVYEPTIWWSGEKIKGIVQVNPASGEIVFHKYGEVPQWVDRVIPANFVERYLTWNGSYRKGWLNSWWAKLELTEPESAILIYSEKGEPEWVTGITSSNEKDQSLIGVVYTNARTGKSVSYAMKGGSTDAGAIAAVNSNSEVQFKHLHGTVPQIYNVFGKPTFVVPLLNAEKLYQGVALVEVTNVQNIAVGADQYEALRKYERILGAHGQQIALSGASQKETMKATVVRIASEPLSGGGAVYNMYVDKDPAHLYTVSSTEHPEVTITRAGDIVQFTFVKVPGLIIPLVDFDNLSLPLKKSSDEKAVEGAAKLRQKHEDDFARRETLEQRMKAMPTDMLEKILNPHSGEKK